MTAGSRGGPQYPFGYPVFGYACYLRTDHISREIWIGLERDIDEPANPIAPLP